MLFRSPGRGDDPAPFVDGGSTVPETTVAVSTTGAPAAEGIVATPAPAEGTSLWFQGPVAAVSTGEAWAFIPAEGYPAGLIGHLKDGAWTYWRLTADPASLGDIAVAADGTVWAATSSGVFSFDGTEWTRQFDPAGAVTVAQDGTLWIGGRLDRDWFSAPFWMARWDGESFTRMDPWPLDPPAFGIPAMAATPDGEVWIASTGYVQSDLMRLDGQIMEAVPIGEYQDDAPDSGIGPVGVFDIEVAPNGDVWVGGFVTADWDQVVLARYYGAEWTVYDWPFADRSPAGEVLFFDLAVGPDGTLWLSFPGGLGSYDGTTWSLRAATMAEGGIAIVDVAPDGTVWYTDQAGLHTFP